MIKNEITSSDEFIKSTIKAIVSIVAFTLLYILLFLLAIGLTILCGYGAILVIAIKPNFITLALGFGLASMGFMVLLFLIKFLFKTHKTDKSHLIEITKNEEPKLFQLIDELTTTIDTQKPKRVYLSPDVNASVFYDSNFWSMFFPIKKNLVIGLGLINALTEEELKAILSHEFAHFSQSTMKVGSYVYSVNNVIHNLLYDNESYENMISKWSEASGYFSIFMILAVKIVSGIQWILRQMYSYVNTRYLKLSREMEFQADEIAAYVTGSTPLINSLLRMELIDYSFNNTISFYEQKIESNIKPKNIYHNQFDVLNFLADQDSLKIKQDLPQVSIDDLNKYNKSKLNIDNQWASHPSTKDRVEKLKAINVKPSNAKNSSANSILNSHIKRQQQLTDHIFKDVEYSNNNFKEYSPSDFINEYETYHIDNSFDPIFKGYYDIKDIANFELHQFLNDESINFKSLFSSEILEDVIQYEANKTDIDVLTKIKNKEFKIKTFDYDGEVYNSKHSATIINNLKKETKLLKEKIHSNDINIYLFFKKIEKDNLKTEKLTTLYKNYFEYYNKFENLITVYNDISEALHFLQNNTKFEAIKTNFKQVKLIEKRLKQHIDYLYTNQLFKTIITADIDKVLKKYKNANYTYFDNNSYLENELEILFTVINFYQHIISKGQFIVKKEIIDYQKELTNYLSI